MSSGRVVGTWRGWAIADAGVGVGILAAPLAVSWSGVSERPFLAHCCRRVGCSGTSCYWCAYRPLVVNWKVWSLVARRLLRWPMLAGSASGFDYALSVWSTRFVDVGVAVQRVFDGGQWLVADGGQEFSAEGWPAAVVAGLALATRSSLTWLVGIALWWRSGEFGQAVRCRDGLGPDGRRAGLPVASVACPGECVDRRSVP